MFFRLCQIVAISCLAAILVPMVVFANTPPTISGTPATSVNVDEEYLFQPEADDADGDQLTFTIRRKPDWLTFDTTTGELRGTPTLADVGLYENILLLVTDGTEQAELPKFDIEVINPPPVISGVPGTFVDAGEQYSFQPIASDPNGDQLTYSIINKPGWASFNTNTGELSGTSSPTKTRNYRDIVISVSDGMSTVSLPAFYIAVIAGQFDSDCTATMQTGESFSCQLPNDGTVNEFLLVDPPRGFSIQAKTGIVHWTPTTDQVGQHYLGVTARGGGNSVEWTVDVNVAYDTEDAAGIYVAPDGDDGAAGTATAPYKTIRQAADNAVKGDTIYLRGGIYYNEEYGTPFENRSSGSMARMTTSGTISEPITLRPYGNEYVKLVSDVTALQFKDAQHWLVENLELEGTAQSLSLTDSMALWWTDDNLKITGRGISTNDSQNIMIRNNVIHDFAGAGIGNNGSDMITVENNIIYNTSWWSTAGTHGVANSYLTTVPGNEGKEGLKMIGNLVFANQSRVISHVFSKGLVTLAIDEGNGLHAQNNSESYFGTARIENNLMLFNGKAGFGINTMDQVVVKNNSFYQNAQVAAGSGELRIQSSSVVTITKNLFDPLPDRNTVNDSSNDYSRMNGNASTYGADSDDMPPSTLYTAVFSDTEALDFTPADGIPADMGVPASELSRMFAKVEEYGIMVQAPAQETIDEAYLATIKQTIFDNWPEFRSDIELTDGETNYTYTFSQRCSYPNEPANTPCPFVQKAISDSQTLTFDSTLVQMYVTDAGTCTDVKITRVESNHPNSVGAQETGQYWTIKAIPEGCTGFDINLTLPLPNGADGDEEVCRSSGSSWDCGRNSSTASDVTRNNITQFSDWAVGDPDLGPLMVELASFIALADGDQVHIQWQTVSEQNNLGFNLYRSTSASLPELGGTQGGQGTEGGLIKLNPSLIPAQAPGSGQGSPYEWQDESVEAGESYYYWLEDIDVNGQTSLHGPISATVNMPTAITLEGFSIDMPTISVWMLISFMLMLLMGGWALRLSGVGFFGHGWWDAQLPNQYRFNGGEARK